MTAKVDAVRRIGRRTAASFAFPRLLREFGRLCMPRAPSVKRRVRASALRLSTRGGEAGHQAPLTLPRAQPLGAAPAACLSLAGAPGRLRTLGFSLASRLAPPRLRDLRGWSRSCRGQATVRSSPLGSAVFGARQYS